MNRPTSRALLAEALGTALLLAVIVGSGLATAVPGTDPVTGHLAHALAVGLGLGALIALLLPASGAHFNPAVTLSAWRNGSIAGHHVPGYITAQVVGATVGVAVANTTFGHPALTLSAAGRTGPALATSEALATFVLVLVILGLVRTRRTSWIPVAVGAWVACAVVATASTGFANPAVTIARTFAAASTGIAPASAWVFVVAQLAGAALAVATVRILFPEPGHTDPTETTDEQPSRLRSSHVQ